MKDILISFLIALVIGCFINSYNDSNKTALNPDMPNNQVSADIGNTPNSDSNVAIKKQPNITNQNVYNNNNPGNNPMLHGNLK